MQLIDVREADEWAGGRLHSARHIPKGSIEREIASHVPDQAAAIVVYCAGGTRSAAAADTLQRMGYQDVYSMKGGIKAWSGAGLPVES